MKKFFIIIFVISFWFFNFNQNISYWNTWSFDNAQYMEDCAQWQDCLDQPTFQIWVWSITPWILAQWENIEERTNWLLWTLIQRMMIALWVLSVFIMTIWAWYIILNNWQDELLSKWKTIFMAWIYSVLISLTSYYLISVIRYLLFT